MQRLGTDSVQGASFWDGRRLKTSSVGHNLPTHSPLALFEMEVSTFLHFPISCLSQGNIDLKPSTARDRPLIDNSEPFGSRNSYSRINDCTNCQISGFERQTEVLKKQPNFSAIPARTDTSRPQECKNMISPRLDPQYVQIHQSL